MCGLGYIVIDQTPGSDITQHLNDAMTLAKTQGKAVYCANSGVISSTVELKASLFCAGVNEVKFTSPINDGSPVFSRMDGDYITLSGFAVVGQAGNDVIGIQLGDPHSPDISGTSVSRSTLVDVTVSWCALGISHRGWINRYSRVTVDYCDAGVELDLQNGSDIDLICEQNKKDFRITNSTSMSIPNLMIEGNRHEAANELDNAKGLVIGSMYIEDGGASTEPWVVFGTSVVPSYNIKVGSISISGSGLPNEVVRVNNVDGFSAGVIEYHCADTVSVTALARSVHIDRFNIA